jgi:pimeloyl-ACP methyl ester carboxylesterase
MKSIQPAILIWIVLLSFFFMLCPAHAGDQPLTELVHLKTTDNVRLSGVLRQPHDNLINSAVIMVHGYGGNFYSGIMDFLPQALTASGFTTLALNMRDHDLGPKRNRFEENLLDIAAGVKELDRKGFDSLFLYGHSMGSNRVLYYLAATKDTRIKGAVVTGPPGNLFKWNVKVFGQEAATRVLQRAQQLVAKGKGNELMVIDLGPLGKALYTANHVVSLRGPNTLSDPFRNISQFSMPVLILHGLGDRLADPTVADQLKKNAGPDSRVTVVKIAGADHRFRGHQEALAETITKWMFEQLRQ